LYTGKRLRKLRYIHSWNFYSGPHGLLHMLIITAGRRLLCFMHCCHSVVALLTLRWLASHYVAAITVLYYVQCPTLQVALYNGTLIYSEPPLIPEHFHLLVLALLSQQTLIATISLLLQPHLGSGLLRRLQY
jgi:hypothetical protein